MNLSPSLDVWDPALKINCGPPTANLWSDWSPQKHVNRVKLNQRQKVRKSYFNQQFGHDNEHCFCSYISQNRGTKTVFETEFEGTEQWFWDQKSVWSTWIEIGAWWDQMSVSKLIRLLNIHFLVNLGLQKYNTTLLIPPFKNTVTPFGPPKFFWSPNHGCRGCWF